MLLICFGYRILVTEKRGSAIYIYKLFFFFKLGVLFCPLCGLCHFTQILKSKYSFAVSGHFIRRMRHWMYLLICCSQRPVNLEEHKSSYSNGEGKFDWYEKRACALICSTKSTCSAVFVELLSKQISIIKLGPVPWTSVLLIYFHYFFLYFLQVISLCS